MGCLVACFTAATQQAAAVRGGFPLWLAVPAVLLYAISAGRYVQLWRRHHSLMLLAVPSALILLAESMVAIAFARNWHLSWWEWHVLLLVAFGLVALSAQTSWREERFAELYLPQTSAGSREISVMFADLEGFTAFSETHEAGEVARMLNEYFAAAVPAVVTPYGGDVDRIIGDALMVTFNKRGDQPDHAERAAGAALALQEATSRLAEHHPDWPRFRAGINSGQVSVSLLGAEGGRTHTIVGDTVNIASRIESTSPTGGVAIGPDTKALLPHAVTTPLGEVQLKGRQEPACRALVDLAAQGFLNLRFSTSHHSVEAARQLLQTMHSRRKECRAALASYRMIK